MDMDMDMDMELGFIGCSSDTVFAGNICCGDWLPAVDWGLIPADDDFHGLLENCGLSYSPGIQDWSTSVSATSTNCPGTPLCEVQPAFEAAESVGEDNLGLRVVHLLMAAAEALTGADKSRDLAKVILARLKDLLACSGAGSIERIVEHFADALQGILDGGRQHEEPPHHPGEVLEAFQLLQDMSPYVKFGHFTANQAILEAVAGERRVHIVDYDIMEGVQWASLMQAMVSCQDGQTPPQLRITAATRYGGGRRSVTPVLETGRRLANFAASIGLQFSFGHCRFDSEEQFRPEAVKVVKGEAVVFNCAVHPPHHIRHSATSVASFLSGACRLGAVVVTVVEETPSGVRGSSDVREGFVGLFMEELRRYSAIWDSLEAGFPMQGSARWTVEKLILAPMIKRAVERAYRRQDEREDGWDGWADFMEAAGFKTVGLSSFNLSQSRLLLGLFNDGHRVEEEAPNKLVFCWKACRLLLASVWLPPAFGSPEAGYLCSFKDNFEFCYRSFVGNAAPIEQ